MGTRTTWLQSKFKGVRYRLHSSRKHGVQPDKYFAIRFQYKGKRMEEGLGWASGGMTEQKAALELASLKEAAKRGKGPVRLQEKREIADAERVKKQAEKERAAREGIIFDEMFSQYLEWAEGAKKHWQNDEYRYRNHLKKTIGHSALKDISPFTIEKIKASLKKKGLAPATIRHCFAIVRQVFNKAILWQKFDGQNPTKKVKPPSVDNAKQRILTTDEEAVLFPALLQKSENVHDMAVMSLYAGLRFGEIAVLKWQAVDFQHNILNIEGKGGKFRAVPMSAVVRKMLLSRSAGGISADNLIFPNSKGKVANKISATFPRVIEDLVLNEGMDKRHRLDFHSMRHTFASRLAMAGIPLTVLRDLLGHRDLQMVSRYSHLIPSMAEKAISALEEYQGQEENVISINQ